MIWPYLWGTFTVEMAVQNGTDKYKRCSLLPSALRWTRLLQHSSLPETDRHPPAAGSSAALVSCWTEEDVGDDCSCFISPSRGWTEETLHGGGTPAPQEGIVGQAECGLYRAAIADTGAECAQNITDKLLFASVQPILLLEVHLTASSLFPFKI